MVDKITNWIGERQSRRGFLARCGKMSLALGMAMAGADRMALTAHAQCCLGLLCDSIGSNCPPLTPVQCGPIANGCPAGCMNGGAPSACCDVATNICNFCYNCNCGGIACECECATNVVCGTTGLC